MPIFRTEEERVRVAGAVDGIVRAVSDSPGGHAVRLEVDWRDVSPGFKFNHWELRGVPFRLEIGPRDVAAEQAVLVKRVDRGKEALPLAALAGELAGRLDRYHDELFRRALDFREANTRRIDTYAEFRATLEEHGGFILAPWCGNGACERQISEETGATIRVIPTDAPAEPGACLIDGRPSDRRALFARAY